MILEAFERGAFGCENRSTGDVLSGELSLLTRGFLRVLLGGRRVVSAVASLVLAANTDRVVLGGTMVGSDALAVNFVREEAR